MEKVVYPLTVTIELEFNADDAPPREIIERQLERVILEWLNSLGATVQIAAWRGQ